jgi:MYXO-CTERM domain-containing protein
MFNLQRTRLFVLAISTTFTLAGAAQAVDYYWDQNGVAAGFGNGTGTWGTDQFWTADTTGAFTNPAGGVLTTTSADTATVNEAKINNATSSVSGNVHALTLWGPAAGGGINTFIDAAGGGTIHLYQVADMTNDATRQATAAINGRGNDTRLNIAAPIVLEQPGGSDVLIDARGGNNSATNITGSVTSTNLVNLTFNGAGHGEFGDLDLQGGSFTGDMRSAHNRSLTMNGVIGSGVTDVTYDGWFHAGLNRITTMVLANAANAYTGDTTLLEGRLRITTDTSLPSTTTVFVTSPGVSGDTSLVLDNPGTNIIAGLWLGGVEQAPGIYNSANGLGFLSGNGSLTVVAPTAGVPEPSTFVLALLGLVGLALRRRRRNR